ncbi:hypothetical protein SELMODRAFT_405432 [Selaginella moellendorffii]|uniref:Uncharacterized protein n=1 Tax=Selaginella moellendorffii TaxID=88036 RepID=D8QYK1_SELML|nr:hypothetical protein SELMODRAFT_405432 [Selaginella moellendorffii]
MPSSIVESTITWFIEKRNLRRNWVAAQQLRELFDTAKTLYCHALAIQTYSYMFEVVLHSMVYASKIRGALVWEEATIDVGGPHAKAIKEVVCQISRSESCIGILGCQCILGCYNKKHRMWLSLWASCYSKHLNVMHKYLVGV